MLPKSAVPANRPMDYVRRLAEEKAFAVPMLSGEVILGADTTVVIDDQVLEKPRDTADAMRMLGCSLAASTRSSPASACGRNRERSSTRPTTRVRFVDAHTARNWKTYAASGEPMDKAGAYAIQGLASKFIDRIEGDYFNVVGLPVALVYRYWKRWPPTRKCVRRRVCGRAARFTRL